MEVAVEQVAGLVDELLHGTVTAVWDGRRWFAPFESASPRLHLADGPWEKAMQSGLVIVEPTDVEGHRGVWCLPLADGAGDSLGCMVVWSALYEEPRPEWWPTLRRMADVAAQSLARLRAEEAVLHAASHDAVTGLYNRDGFTAAVADACDAAPGSLLVVDLDVPSEPVLAAAARRLGRVVRPDDVVGRFDGDEVVVFLPGADEGVAVLVAERVIAGFGEPIDVDGEAVPVAVSIGVDATTGRALDDQLAAARAALRSATHPIAFAP